MATGTTSREGGQEIIFAPRLVARQAPFELLSAAEKSGRVRLVSAPAGSGKTVVLRSWLDEAALRERAAWVSIRRAEQDG